MFMFRPQKKGFSLIECMIAILVMTFLLLGGMSFYHCSDDYLYSTATKRIAADLANSRLEFIKSWSYTNVTTLPDCSGSVPPEAVKIGELDANLTCCLDPAIPAGFTGSHVRARVKWLQPRQDNPWNVTLDTLIVQPS